MRAAILTEAGPPYGFGHLSRCLALADALEEKQIATTLFVQGKSIPQEMCGSRNLFQFSWQADLQQTLLKLREFSLIVFDSYSVELDFLRSLLTSVSALSLVIDDLGSFVPPSPSTIVLNSAFYAHDFVYKDCRFPHLIGPEYILLRKEFWDIKPSTKKSPPQKIFYQMGSLPNFENHADHLRAILLRRYPLAALEGLDRLQAKSALEMSEIMRTADLAVSAGGQTLYELLRYGIPALVFAVADNQIPTLKALSALGGVNYLGDLASMLEGDAFSLLVEKEITNMPSDRSKNPLIDGQGARRVVKELVQYKKAF
jgi:UDP-2,4-diacetamido-2,4,6-trideoxy-beta-L-altropyranose hydrolase